MNLEIDPYDKIEKYQFASTKSIIVPQTDSIMILGGLKFV